MEYLEIFSACIQTYPTKLDIDSLTSFCYEVKRRDSKGRKISNLGGWQSGNIKKNPHPEFVKLLSEVQIAANAYHNKLQFKKEYEQKYSYIIENFHSRSLNITSCIECNYKTDNHESLQIISLTLHPKYSSFTDCLDDYVKTFNLDDDNKWTCDKCNLAVNPEKKTIFWNFSPVIIFLIKKYNENGVIENRVDYPIKLDLEKYRLNYKKESTKYELQIM